MLALVPQRGGPRARGMFKRWKCKSRRRSVCGTRYDGPYSHGFIYQACRLPVSACLLPLVLLPNMADRKDYARRREANLHSRKQRPRPSHLRTQGAGCEWSWLYNLPVARLEAGSDDDPTYTQESKKFNLVISPIPGRMRLCVSSRVLGLRVVEGSSLD
jgi:hypothetical protein